MKAGLRLLFLLFFVWTGCSKKVLEVNRGEEVTPVFEDSVSSERLLEGLACEMVEGDLGGDSGSRELILFVRDSNEPISNYEIHSIEATQGLTVEGTTTGDLSTRILVSGATSGEITATVVRNSETASCKRSLGPLSASTRPLGIFLDGLKSSSVVEGGYTWLVWFAPEGSRCQLSFSNGGSQAVAPVGQSVLGPVRSVGGAAAQILLQCEVPELGLRTDSVNLVFEETFAAIRVAYLGIPGPETPIRVVWRGSGDCQVSASIGPMSSVFSSATYGSRTIGPRELPRPTEAFPALFSIQCGSGARSEAFLPVGRRPLLRLTANGVSEVYERPSQGSVEIQWASLGALSCQLSNLNETSLSGTVNIPVSDIEDEQRYTFRCSNPWGESVQELTLRPPSCVESELTVLSGGPKSDGGLINERLLENDYPVMPSTGSVKLDADTAQAICELFDMNTVLEMGCNQSCAYSSPGNNFLMVWRDGQFMNYNAQEEGNRKLGLLVCAQVCSP